MKKSDRTFYDSKATLFEEEQTVYESGTATERETTVWAGKTMSEPARTDVRIQKGSVLLGEYRILSDVISGGMGDVWKVHHLGWDMDMAMKIPKPELIRDDRMKKRFIDECDLWLDLRMQPQIAMCYFVRTVGNSPAVFSEWVDGGSLQDRMDDGSLYADGDREALWRILNIAHDSAAALDYASGMWDDRASRLLHRDLKPANFLLTKDWRCKVTDFGIARYSNEKRVLRSDTYFLTNPEPFYTAGYCSPEQMEGRELTTKTDVYSWALTVLAMFCGGRLWMNGTVGGLNASEYIDSAMIPVPEKLKKILLNALNKDPLARRDDYRCIFRTIQGLCRELFPDRPFEGPVGLGLLRPKNNHALSELEMGNPQKALSLLQEAVADDPGDVNACFNLALFHLKTVPFSAEKYDSALKALKNAAGQQKDPAAAEKAESLIRLLEGTGGNPSAAKKIPWRFTSVEKEAENVRKASDRVHDGLHLSRVFFNAVDRHEVSAAEKALSDYAEFLGTKRLGRSEEAEQFRKMEKRLNIQKEDGLGSFHWENPSAKRQLQIYDRYIREPSCSIVSSGSGPVSVMDLTSSREIASLKSLLHGHRKEVCCTALSGDARLAATADLSGRIILWNVERQKYLTTFPALPEECSRFKDFAQITTLCFFRNGELLAAANNYGRIGVLRIGQDTQWRMFQTDYFGDSIICSMNFEEEDDRLWCLYVNTKKAADLNSRSTLRGYLRVWKMSDGSPVGTTIEPQDIPLYPDSTGRMGIWNASRSAIRLDKSEKKLYLFTGIERDAFSARKASGPLVYEVSIT